MRTSLWGIGFTLVLVLLLAAPAALGAEEELKRDDGNREGKQSSAGTGHVVSFEAPKGKWYVRTVRVHGQRYGGGYDAKTTTEPSAEITPTPAPRSSSGPPGPATILTGTAPGDAKSLMKRSPQPFVSPGTMLLASLPNMR